MENLDDVKKEVRARIEKFEEIVEALPKHQKAFNEIKAFLETSFSNCIILSQQQNELSEINLYFLKRSEECNDTKAEEINKTMEEDALLKIKSRDIINENRALIEKSIVGKELITFEMFFKKEHLRETLSSSEEFLLSLKKETSESFLISLETGRLELEERLKSVSFGETALEEKKRNSFDKEKEIANSFSATEFKKLNEEKKELSEEIFSISKFIDETKQNLTENEKKSSVSLEVKKNINIDVLEKVYEECKKVKAGLEEEIRSFCYVFSSHSVFEMCRDFINRSFIKDASLLKEWLAMGKKATIVHIKSRNMKKDLMWKEWDKKEDEMIKWLFTKKCGSHGEYRDASITFAINEQVGMEINISM